MEDLYQFERELYKKGLNYIGGVDEVGRGPLVGPVISACVILPKGFKLDGLTDSKKLSSKKRNLFYDIIMEQALAVGIGEVSAKRIDQINIYQASKEAMMKAIKRVLKTHQLDYLLIDAMKLDIDIPHQSIIKGDSKSISIAAASVIAKVTRDRIMDDLDVIYPLYGFKNHKGYPTKFHLASLKKYGIFNEYRCSYKPVKHFLEENN